MVEWGGGGGGGERKVQRSSKHVDVYEINVFYGA